MRYDWIFATTDYGLEDGFVATCTGVMGRIAPHARVVDVTHAIPRADVRRASAVLAQAVPYLPAAVHLVVVDPGVGTTRRGVAVTGGDSVFVGPDNGVLPAAAAARGQLLAAFELSDPQYRLADVSSTFHGRDIFAPAAAHLASGVQPAALGPRIDLATLVRLPEPVVRLSSDGLLAEVTAVDHFGNVQLAGTAADLAASGLVPGDEAELTIAGRREAATVARTFGEVPAGDLLVLVDSAGHIAAAVNGDSASQRLGVAAGALVHIARRATAGGTRQA